MHVMATSKKRSELQAGTLLAVEKLHSACSKLEARHIAASVQRSMSHHCFE